MKNIVLFIVALNCAYISIPIWGEEISSTTLMLSKAFQAYERFEKTSQVLSIECIGMKDQAIIDKVITQLTINRNHELVSWEGHMDYFNAENDPLCESRIINNYALSNKFIELEFYHERRGYWFASGYLTKQKCDYMRRENLEKLDQGGAMDGYLLGNDCKNVIELIESSPNKLLHEQTELIKGISCYVLEAKTSRGVIKAWVAPEYGYNTLKWSVEKSPDNLHWDGKSMRELDWLGLKAEFEFDAIEKFGDEYVITSGQLKHDTQFKNEDGNQWHLYKYKRDSIDLNPDYEALGAFKVDLPENTVVWGRDVGANFEFINGELIPFIDEYVLDVIDSEVNEMMQGKPQDIKPEKKAVISVPANEPVEPAIEHKEKELLNNDLTEENESATDKQKNTWLESPLWIVAMIAVLGAAFFIIYRRRV